jgi:hypothetical protein
MASLLDRGCLAGASVLDGSASVRIWLIHEQPLVPRRDSLKCVADPPAFGRDIKRVSEPIEEERRPFNG